MVFTQNLDVIQTGFQATEIYVRVLERRRTPGLHATELVLAIDPDELAFFSISLADPTGASEELSSFDQQCPSFATRVGGGQSRAVNIVGDWILTVVARDCCGQESTAMHTVIVDGSDPLLTIDEIVAEDNQPL